MKHRFLILGISLMVLSLALAWTAYSETTIGVSAKSSGAGFDSGFGLSAEHIWKPDWYALGVSGNISNQKKRDADSGYTYGISGFGRIYHNDIYLTAGYGLAGYSYSFASGINWKKSAWWPFVGIGYDADFFDVWLTYYPKETQTVNEVEAWKIGSRLFIYNDWFLSSELSYQTYEQSNKRNRDTTAAFGIGWQF